jgi:hypothetical protein
MDAGRPGYANGDNRNLRANCQDKSAFFPRTDTTVARAAAVGVDGQEVPGFGQAAHLVDLLVLIFRRVLLVDQDVPNANSEMPKIAPTAANSSPGSARARRRWL